MSERNILTGTTTAGLLTIFGDFYAPLIPFLTLALAFVLIDLKFGITAAKQRIAEAKQQGKDFEPVRISRAVRRTINKLTDYVCWVTLAGLFGQAYGTVLGVPALAALMLIIVYSIELISCFNNYFYSRGIKVKVKISFADLFSKLFSFLKVEENNTNERKEHEKNR